MPLPPNMIGDVEVDQFSPDDLAGALDQIAVGEKERERVFCFPQATSMLDSQRGEKQAASHIDFLSALPETLMLHILSLLSTKEAIRTSVLSKTWKPLWTGLTRIKIRHSDFNEGVSHEVRYESLLKTLDLCNAPKLKKLSLGLSEVPSNSFPPLIKLLQFVSQCHVDELSLSLFNIRLPDYLCTNSVISKMSLKGGIHFSNTFSWTALKVLQLSDTLIASNVLTTLLLGCPILERLKLFSYWVLLNDCTETNFFSTSLKELVLSSPRGEGSGFKISAPKLQLLILHGCCFWRCRLVDVSSLVAADLSLCRKRVPRVNEALNLKEMAAQHLEKLHRVQILTLCSCYICLLSILEVENPPVFRLDCKSMTINTSFTKYILAGLEKLLRSSPHLEKLTIKKHLCKCDELKEALNGYMDEDYTGEGFWKENRLKSCGLPNLKRVEIIWFDATSKLVSEFMEFLLVNATKLEEMVVVSPDGTEPSVEITKLELS